MLSSLRSRGAAGTSGAGAGSMLARDRCRDGFGLRREADRCSAGASAMTGVKAATGASTCGSGAKAIGSEIGSATVTGSNSGSGSGSGSSSAKAVRARQRGRARLPAPRSSAGSTWAGIELGKQERLRRGRREERLGSGTVLLRGLGRLHIFPGDDVWAHNKLRRLLGDRHAAGLRRPSAVWWRAGTPGRASSTSICCSTRSAQAGLVGLSQRLHERARIARRFRHADCS